MGNVSKTNPTNPYVSDSSSVHHTAGGGSSQSESWADPSSVWSGQSPYLEGLYQRGAGMATGPQFGQQGAMNLFGRGMQTLNRMQRPGENPQMRMYSRAIGRDFNRNILPQINDQAAGFGQLGGSRQGVAQGLAASDARQQMQDFGAQLYDQDRNRMLQAASMAPTMGAFGMNIPWYGLQQYAGILGRPTVLSGAAGSTSSSSNWSSGGGSSVSHGEGGGGGGGWGVGINPLPKGTP